MPWTFFGGLARILVDVRSASAIADGIESALARAASGYSLDPDLFRALEARHGKETVARDYVTVYRRLIAASNT